MKKIVLFFTIVFFPLTVIAQDCTTYMYLDNNGSFQFTQFDNSGEKGLVINYYVTDVQNIAGGMSSQVLSIMRDKSGKIIDSVTGIYKCVNGKLYVDMRSSMPSMGTGQFKGMQVKANESWLEYPYSMSPGESLPGGSYNMQFIRNGQTFSSVNYTVESQKVDDEEEVTTPAGTWNCFHITSQTVVTMKMSMGLGMQMTRKFMIIEWFAPGFGIVKSQDFDQNGQSTGSMVLTSMTK